MNAEPRVQHVSRKDAKELNGNARQSKCRALLLLTLADLALVGGFQQTKDKLEELMKTPLTEKTDQAARRGGYRYRAGRAGAPAGT